MKKIFLIIFFLAFSLSNIMSQGRYKVNPYTGKMDRIGSSTNIYNKSDTLNDDRYVDINGKSLELKGEGVSVYYEPFNITQTTGNNQGYFQLSQYDIGLGGISYFDDGNYTSEFAVDKDVIEFFHSELDATSSLTLAYDSLNMFASKNILSNNVASEIILKHNQVLNNIHSAMGRSSELVRGTILDETGLRYNNINSITFSDSTLVTKEYVDNVLEPGGLSGQLQYNDNGAFKGVGQWINDTLKLNNIDWANNGFQFGDSTGLFDLTSKSAEIIANELGMDVDILINSGSFGELGKSLSLRAKQYLEIESEENLVIQSDYVGIAADSSEFFAGGIHTRGFSISPSQFQIYDNRDQGVSYKEDYSSNNLSNPRWIVDKQYVDNVFKPGGLSGQLQYNDNGVFKGVGQWDGLGTLEINGVELAFDNNVFSLSAQESIITNDIAGIYATNELELFSEEGEITIGAQDVNLFSDNFKIFKSGKARFESINLNSMQVAPVSTSAPGEVGEIRITSDFIYVCIAANTWRRTALQSWGAAQ